VAENMRLKHENATISIESDSSATISADAFHFTNIVYNLLDNAIKYSDREPHVVVRTINIAKGLKIEFRDNGIGVPPKKINDIFDKFYRVPSQKSNEVNGFGLGLYYVKKICTLHHWKITAANNEGAGLTVTISIPL
jgi:two-component system phosphate regulon sensor histidine kinase PhoR